MDEAVRFLVYHQGGRAVGAELHAHYAWRNRRKAFGREYVGCAAIPAALMTSTFQSLTKLADPGY